METKISYTMVGLFVIILGIMIIIIPLWLSSSLTGKKYNIYEVYMSESVAGLNPNSTVKYNGVDVGYVHDIAIDTKDPTQVDLLLKIQEGTPINTGTTASLMVQGLTGVAYVALQGGAGNLPPLVAGPNQRYPVIKTSPSLFLRLDTVANQIATSFNKISASINQLLSQPNLFAISNSLNNINRITTALALDTNQLNQSITSANIFLANSAKASQQFPIIIKNFNDTDNQFDNLAQSINTTTLPVLNDALANIQSLTQQLKQNPSILIRGNAPPPPGPGE